MQNFEACPGGPSTPGRDVYTVSRLNREARMLLEGGLGSVWIEGELSNLSRPASGHWYFSLKDAQAQLRCAMFRQRNLLVRFPVRDGAQVMARGRVSLYEARGEFQLVVEHLEEAGEGLLRRRFEELKQKLAAAGLFDQARKKPLPRLPRRIGVVTSPTGAAVRDILHVLGRRFPAIPVLIYPVAVQGEAAPAEISETLELAGLRADCDVLILARGGGSLEDLWAFNDERVARAISDCPVPVVCGVGHETDVTIADFVADERAPTPSAAAERCVPDRTEWLRAVEAWERRISLAVRRRIGDARQQLAFRESRLARSHPGVRLRQHAQRLDELDARLRRGSALRLERARTRVYQAQSLLQRSSPQLRMAAVRLRLDAASRSLAAQAQAALGRAQRRLDLASRTLAAVGPLATLSRGYAIVTDRSGHVVTDVSEIGAGAEIEARLAKGILAATVTGTRGEDG
jgi:exodeoxyribonuclease VII large subunit